jgi:hypothetical protein
MWWLCLPPRALYVGKEADSGRAQMVLLLARARSASTRPSSRLVVLPQPRVAPSAVGALVAPRRSQPLDSRTAAWPQRRGCGTPTGRVVEHQRRRWSRHSRPHWRLGCCRVPFCVSAPLVRGRVAGQQPDGARVSRRFPCRAPPA